MATKIGYQDGISGFVNYMRKIPGVKYRDMAERPATLEQWSWLEKLERTLRILKDAHDAAIPDTNPPPPTPPDPPPTGELWFPRTYNKAPNGSDARYCCTAFDPAYARHDSGLIWDKGGASYDDNGLCVNGVRSANTLVPGLKPANEMDGRSPCELYGGMSEWPDGSRVR